MATFKIQLLCLFLIHFLSSVVGQNYLRYDVGNGLPSSKVYSLYQDQWDYVWVGSDKGIARFNGKTFEVYGQRQGLSNPLVIGFQEDKQHERLWIRTVGELFFYLDLKSDSIFAYPQQTKLNEALKGGTVLDFSFSGDSALFVFNLHKSRNNFLCITSQESKLQLNAGYAAYTHYIPALQELGSDSVCRQITFPVFVQPHTLLAIKRDAPNTMLIADAARKIVSLKSFPADIRRIFKSKQNNDIWVSTARGVFRFVGGDLNRPPLHLFTNLDVVHIIDNRSGGYWFALFDSDLLFIPSPQQTFLDQQYIYNLAADANNTFWVNAAQGVFKCSLPPDSLFFEQVGESQLAVAAFLTNPSANYKLWIGSNFALNTAQQKAKSFFKEEYNIKTFEKTPSGLIWAGLGKGLILVDPARNTYERKFKDFNHRVTALCWDKQLHKLWVGTSQGLLLLDTATGVFEHKNIAANFPEIYIKTLRQTADGHLWIGTQGLGLWAYNPKTQQFQSFSAELTQDFINCIYLQNDTAIWVGTNQGCYYKNMGDQRWLHWNRKTGLPHDEVTAIAPYNNQIAIGTAKGLVFLSNQPQHTHFSYMPPLLLTHIEIMGKPYHVDAFSDTLLSLNHNQNSLSFFFESPTFTFKPLFKYRLEGADMLWKTTHLGELHYFGLPPGYYTLHLANQNRVSEWNPRPIKLRFYIAPHFTQTIWFLVVLVSGLVFVVSCFIYWRARLWAKRQSMQRRIIELEYHALKSQMNPHFVFNAMQSILALIKTNQKEDAQKYLVQLSKLMRTILEHSFLQFVPLEQEIKALQLYINIELMRWRHKVSVVWNLPDIIPHTLLPPMLLQPLIENAFVHAFQNKDHDCLLTLSVLVSDAHWSFVIQDNGVGRKAAAAQNINRKQKSTALANVQERIQKIKEAFNVSISLFIEDLYMEQISLGTKITLILPLSGS